MMQREGEIVQDLTGSCSRPLPDCNSPPPESRFWKYHSLDVRSDPRGESQSTAPSPSSEDTDETSSRKRFQFNHTAVPFIPSGERKGAVATVLENHVWVDSSNLERRSFESMSKPVIFKGVETMVKKKALQCSTPFWFSERRQKGRICGVCCGDATWFWVFAREQDAHQVWYRCENCACQTNHVADFLQADSELT